MTRAARYVTMVCLGLAMMVVWLPGARAQEPPPGEDAKDQPAAGADEAASDPGRGDGEAPKVKVERGAGGKKVYRITTGFVIEGRIQKPNAFYVLERSQINYDWAALKQDFLPRILESVKKHPF